MTGVIAPLVSAVLAVGILLLASLCIVQPRRFAPDTLLATVLESGQTGFGQAAIADVHTCDTQRRGRWVVMLPGAEAFPSPPRPTLLLATRDRRCGLDVLTASTVVRLPVLSLRHHRLLRVLFIALAVLMAAHLIVRPLRATAQGMTLALIIASVVLTGCAAVLCGLPYTVPQPGSELGMLNGIPWWGLFTAGAIAGAACGGALRGSITATWRLVTTSQQRHRYKAAQVLQIPSPQPSENG